MGARTEEGQYMKLFRRTTWFWLVSCILYAVCSVVLGAPGLSEINETAKTLGGLGPSEIMALVCIVTCGTCVYVVRLLVTVIMRDIKSLIDHMKNSPCLYEQAKKEEARRHERED
jgi:hypothetical protein